MRDNFWDPSAGQQGLFDVWSFKGIDAIISSGLGGGSLIYANVLLRKDPKWFVEEDRVGSDGSYWTWPVGRAELDPHYDRVEQMMRAQTFPFSHPDYASTPKTIAMRDAAQRLGLDWQLPPLAVSFANPGRAPRRGEPLEVPEYGNLHGLPQVTCRMCGECDIGCNDGAKNTLDHTYLSAAKHAGAEIRTRSEVRTIEPLPDGRWRVGYVAHDPATMGRKTDTDRLPVIEIDCRRLVLGAGTLGSTFLLLKNRGALRGISPMLGQRFSGNGDLLGFMHSAKESKRRPRILDGANGPVITSAIRLPDAADERAPDARSTGTDRGAYIEDAGYPGFASWLVESTRTPHRFIRYLKFGIKRLIAQFRPSMRSNWSSAITELMGDSDFAASSLPLLGMGRDTPDGTMTVQDGFLEIDWSIESSKDYFDRVGNTMEEIAGALDAKFEPNLLTRLARVITVHPLGGVPMGRSIEEGVVDDHGRVFGLPGLYVVDGSVMPGPVGANPALTIAAFADRAADAILNEDENP